MINDQLETLAAKYHPHEKVVPGGLLDEGKYSLTKLRPLMLYLVKKQKRQRRQDGVFRAQQLSLKYTRAMKYHFR